MLHVRFSKNRLHGYIGDVNFHFSHYKSMATIKSVATVSCHSNQSAYLNKNNVICFPCLLMLYVKLVRICIMPSEEILFENVDGWRQNDGCLAIL